jgi:MFS family permease
VPENSLHQCQNGCFQVCSDCLPENSKCQECLEYCIITPKVAKDILEIIQKHESRTIPTATIKSYMEKIYETIGENGIIILSLIIVTVIAKYFMSNATFFQVLFLLFVIIMGSVIGASTAMEAFKREHRDKSQIMQAFLFIFVFPLISMSSLMLGGIIGLVFGCVILLIWNLWSLGYFIEGIVCIIAIFASIHKLLQHEQYASELNHKWRNIFGRPLF